MSTIVYRFKVTFEDVDDVERVIEIKAGQTFLDLHQAIQDAIGFDNSKAASFYMSGDNWRKGKEISTEEDRGDAMKDAHLNRYVYDPHQKILYVTDFDANWTLRVELVKISPASGSAYPQLVKSSGEAPKQYKPVRVNDANEFDEMVSDYRVDIVPDGIDNDEGERDDTEDSEVDGYGEGEEDSEY